MAKKDRPGVSRFSEEQSDLLAMLVESEGVDVRTTKHSLFDIEPDPAARYLPFPLTEIQQAYLIGRDPSFDLGNVSSHAYMEYDTAGLDLERYQLAWRRLIERHDTLRTVIHENGEQQILEDVSPYEFKVLDLRDKTPEEAEEVLLSVREEMSHEILPLGRWPMFDVRYSLIDEDRVRLHLSFDAILLDVSSYFIMLEEIRMFYENPQSTLPALEISFRDYVLALRKLENTENYRKAEDYWRKRIPSLPPAPEFRLRRDLSAIPKPRFKRLHATWEADHWKSVKTCATKAGLTPTTVLLTAFAEVLRLWNRHQSFCLNITLFNRRPLHPQISDILGDFTDLLLLEVENMTQATFLERARHLHDRFWHDMEHREFNGVEVIRELISHQSGGKNRARALMPVVFTSVFNVEDVGKGMTLDGRQFKINYSISQTPQVLIDHQVYKRADSVGVNWDVVEEAFPVGLLDDMFWTTCSRHTVGYWNV
jgi:hypothetical protein